MNLVEALLAILPNSEESHEVRARAAISLGPNLEYADTERFDDPDDVPISERHFQQIQKSLRELYMDEQIPNEVRRRILEASVRAPQEWHKNAVLAAYSSGDNAWKLTAVFCMRLLREFDNQIVEELENENPDIQLEAVLAAANWGVAAGWPQIAALIHSGRTPKPLLLAAIEAVPAIRPQEASEVLSGLIESDDEDTLPNRHEVVVLSLLIFPYLEYKREQSFSHPADGSILLWQVSSLVKLVGCEKISCASSKPIPRLGFAFSRLLVRLSKWNRILGITVIHKPSYRELRKPLVVR